MPLINPKMDKIALGNIKCFKVIIMALQRGQRDQNGPKLEIYKNNSLEMALNCIQCYVLHK